MEGDGKNIRKLNIPGTVVRIKIKVFNFGGCQQTFKTGRAWKATSGARTKR